MPPLARAARGGPPLPPPPFATPLLHSLTQIRKQLFALSRMRENERIGLNKSDGNNVTVVEGKTRRSATTNRSCVITLVTKIFDSGTSEVYLFKIFRSTKNDHQEKFWLLFITYGRM